MFVFLSWCCRVAVLLVDDFLLNWPEQKYYKVFILSFTEMVCPCRGFVQKFLF